MGATIWFGERGSPDLIIRAAGYIGCGLRRDELLTLRVDSIQMRESTGSSPTYWAKPVTSIRVQSPVGSRRRSMNGRMPEHVSQGVAQTTERYLGCKQKLRCAVNDRIGIETDHARSSVSAAGYRPPLGDKRVSIAGISIRDRRPPQSDMPTTRLDGTPIRCPPTGPSESVYQARHRPIAVARSKPVNSDWVPV